jgi:hypothetical protein
MASFSTLIPTTRTISSGVMRDCLESQSKPCAGMQYEHRRLHLSVTDNRRSVAWRPNRSSRPAGTPEGRPGGSGGPPPLLLGSRGIPS